MAAGVSTRENAAESGYLAVVDPSGRVHNKKIGKRTYTHALVRQNKGSDTYFVNWASSEANAIKESRVLAHLRSHNEIVTL